MKKLFSDKIYLILQIASVAVGGIYLFCTRSYQQTPVWVSWLLSMALFVSVILYSAVKKRWVVTAVNLVLGCLPVAATCLLLWGQEWSVVRMTLIAPFSVLSQEITWFLF